MTSHLIPEQRVNKLGHVVTKHVKPAATSSAAAKLPVILLASGDRATQVSMLTSRFHNRGMAISSYAPHEAKIKRTATRNTLAEYSDLTLRRLEEMPSNADGVIANLLLARSSEHVVNDFLAVMPVMERSLMSAKDINSYLYSLSLTEELTPQGENGEYPEERAAQCLALVEVMKYMEKRQVYRLMRRDDNVGEYPFIDDAKLRNLIIDSGENREAVVSFILDRELLDADHIEALLGATGHSSLMNGGL